MCSWHSKIFFMFIRYGSTETNIKRTRTQKYLFPLSAAKFSMQNAYDEWFVYYENEFLFHKMFFFTIVSVKYLFCKISLEISKFGNL